MKLIVRFRTGAHAGQSQDLPLKPLIQLGRHPENDIVFDPQQDPLVSSYHAEIRQEPDGFYPYDMNVRNGTFYRREPDLSRKIGPLADCGPGG